MKNIYTEYGYYSGKHVNLFMFKNIIKDFLRIFTNKYVIFKCKSIWGVRDRIVSKNLRSGIYTSFYIDYFNKHSSYVGLNTVFKGIPCLPHGFYGVFISDKAVIGKNCVIFQGVTIGSNTLEGSSNFGSPVIGDNCYIGAGAKIIGNVKIGDNVRIGANAIVTTDIPSNSTVVLEKPRIISKKKQDNRFIKCIGLKKYYFDDGLFYEVKKS